MGNEIKTSKHIATRDGCKSVEEWIRKLATRRRIQVSDVDKKYPVVARIDHNRWIADCECSGAEYVDQEEPIFFCFSCNNLAFGGKIRTVIFPSASQIKKIEKGLNKENYYSWNPIEVNHGI